MSATVNSVISRGFTGLMVEIECCLSNSLPGIIIVGSGSRNVDEAKERIRGAFSSAGITMPRKRITINLAPADTTKESSSLDLPIAIAILKASGSIPAEIRTDELFIGELGLDGRVRPVRGIIGKLLSGRERGFRRFYIPQGNLQQARMVPDIELIPVAQLGQLVDHLMIQASLDSIVTTNAPDSANDTVPKTISRASDEHPITLGDIVGQAQAKRALQIAAAGGHNLLLSGPPGSGKSMLAKALATILPPLSREEMLEVTHLHSLSGHEYDQLITARPVRSPHHSTSHTAVIGGGSKIRPGEISLAHRGVLFFDELPEFSRDTIEALRQPLEEKTVTITRARDTIEFPANFIFVATANPCPCGYYTANSAGPPNSTARILCDCPPALIGQYQRKLSGPLLDRIDLTVTVEPVDHTQLLANEEQSGSDRGEATDTSIIRLVSLARIVQHKRFKGQVKLNSDMSNAEVKRYALLTPVASQLLNTAAVNLQLSARSYMRCIKVARTIADLAGSNHIEPEHLTEALRYRPSETRRA